MHPEEAMVPQTATKNYIPGVVARGTCSQSLLAFLSCSHAAPRLFCTQVVEKLQSIYGGLYTDENVLISGIHTHSGPAGYFQYVLFEVNHLTVLGAR